MVHHIDKITPELKGFAHYFQIVWDVLGDSNFINTFELELNPDLKIGLYYIMKCYHLCFTEREWGSWRIICLQDENTKDKFEALNYKDITSRESDIDEFNKLFDDFKNGITPDQKHQTNTSNTISEPKEFGWLSPTGDFTASPFGTHDDSALNICESKGFMSEYWKWVKDNTDDGTVHLIRDFLCQVKGYCLIHNPSGYGSGYIVTNIKSLTNQQKDFLYGYFLEMGDRLKAEQFV